MSAVPRVTIFCVGDGDCGDSGLAPRLLTLLRSGGWGEHWWLKLLHETELQVEHALNLKLSDLALFVESALDARRPWSLEEITAPQEHRGAGMTRVLEAPDLMHTVAALTRGEAPPCFRLRISGDRFASGEPVSDTGLSNLESATALVESLLQSPDAASWRRKAGAG
jgi:hypothetical protein